MPFLIDGYNLLFALGRLTAKSRPTALDGARGWLVDRVRRGHGEAAVTVVFDARTAPAGVPTASQYGGVRVEFAVGQTADDRIEDLVEADRDPKALTVVSDDHRVQRAARRRGCAVLACLDYYERFLDAPRPVAVPPPAEKADKPDHSSPDETRRWLDVFGEADGPPG